MGGPEAGALIALRFSRRLNPWEHTGQQLANPHREGEEPKPMMNGPEKSNPVIVCAE
jgi:hypothetical protein